MVMFDDACEFIVSVCIDTPVWDFKILLCIYVVYIIQR